MHSAAAGEGARECAVDVKRRDEVQQAAGQPRKGTAAGGAPAAPGGAAGREREVGKQQVARVARDEHRVRRADAQSAAVRAARAAPSRRAAGQLPRLTSALGALSRIARESEHVVGHRGARLVEKAERSRSRRPRHRARPRWGRARAPAAARASCRAPAAPRPRRTRARRRDARERDGGGLRCDEHLTAAEPRARSRVELQRAPAGLARAAAG